VDGDDWDEENWEVAADAQPQPAHYQYDLDRALSSVVRLTARVSSDAFMAETLGTERAGNGVLIREDGLILTIGYLVTEAEEVWLTTWSGRVVEGHVLAYDQPTGFGLVQALRPLDLPVMPIGRSQTAAVGARVVIGGAGGRRHSVAAHVVAKHEFAGYWEYVLDEAIFTAPAHPNWGGTAMIGPSGELLGIGSLQVPQQVHGSQVVPINMIVPIDLLPPILDDLCQRGSVGRPPRPWLGLYAAETQDKIVIIGCAGRGPAQRADLREGDIVLAVAGAPVGSLTAFFRAIWELGPAGTDIPLTLDREGDVFDVRVRSGDRQQFLRQVKTH
jgi:S1-C subfamily serine protease